MPTSTRRDHDRTNRRDNSIKWNRNNSKSSRKFKSDNGRQPSLILGLILSFYYGGNANQNTNNIYLTKSSLVVELVPSRDVSNTILDRWLWGFQTKHSIWTKEIIVKTLIASHFISISKCAKQISEHFFQNLGYSQRKNKIKCFFMKMFTIYFQIKCPV